MEVAGATTTTTTVVVGLGAGTVVVVTVAIPVMTRWVDWVPVSRTSIGTPRTFQSSARTSMLRINVCQFEVTVRSMTSGENTK